MTSGQQPKEENRRRGILTVSGFAHFVHDGFTDTIYVLLPLWASGFGLSHAQVGLLKACMSVGLAGLQVPAGYLAERYGERTILILGTALTGLAFLSMALANGIMGLAVLLFIAGVGASTQHPLASALVSKGFENNRRRAALGTYNFCGDLGKVVMPAVVASVAALYGWQQGSAALGLLGLAAALVLYTTLLRMGAGNRPDADPKVRDERASPSEGWGIHDRQGFLTLAAISMIDSACRFAFLTFVPFVLIEKGAATEAVGFSLALVFAGGAAGKLICGLVAERLGILRTVVLTELVTTVLILGVLAVPLSGVMILLPVVGVALNGTSSVLYGTVGDFVHSDRQARAFGLFYTFGTGAGVVSPFLFGLFSDAWGLDAAVKAIATLVLLILPLCLVLRPSLRAAATQE